MGSYSLRQNPATSANYTEGRTANVDKIVIHHAATTDFDGIGRTFQYAGSQVSAHYGVGRDNNVDQYVQDEDTAWAVGNWAANCSSISIENVNLSGGPDWAIDERTVNTLVELVADLARKHGLGQLEFGRNFFGHHDFKQTACPGQLYARLPEIATRANAILGGTESPVPAQAPVLGPDQILEVGSKFKFKDSYRVDNLAVINGIWQIYTAELCPKGFTWNDNGVPTEPVTEVGGGAGNSSDQILQVGSRYSIPGTYTVLDIGQYLDRWMAKVNVGGWYLWVDVESVTEV